MTSMIRTFLVLALAFCAAAPVLAEDAPKGGDAKDPAQLLQQLETTYPRVLRRPKLDLAAAEIDKARAETAKAEDEWVRSVESLASTGDAYFEALGAAAADARAYYYRGVGKAILATHPPVGTQGKALYEAAADSLQRYLDAAGESGAFRADAEMYLGQSLLGAGRADDGIAHLDRAVGLLQKDGRHDEAGASAAAAMTQLRFLHRTADLRAFATKIHATEADFGVSTPTVRRLAAAGQLDVGAPLPELPKVKDADGRDISWAPGKPMLVHFFLSGFLNGMATSFREIETDIRPLWSKYNEKGLVVVGVSMDYEMPKAQADDLRKKWDEWGVKRELRDGSLESVRAWTKKQGIEWQWYWDGKATNDPVSASLGGVGFTSPYAVLVDAKGVVRWHGEAPFKGLADEVAKLFP